MADLPPNVRAGVSTAAIFNAAGVPNILTNNPVFSLSDLTPSGSNPQNAIDASVGSDTPMRVQFPSDLPPYFMKMSISAYKRQNWAEIGSLTSQATVVLPMPIQIMDRQTVSYAQEPLGIIGGLVGGLLAGDTGALGAGRESVLKGAAAAGGVKATGAAGQALLNAAGRQINDFLTVMLKGPTYKKWSFTWKLSAKSAAESQTLYQLRKLLSDAQSPGLPKDLGSAFFTFPKIFQLSFEHISGSTMNSQLFTFKKAVLEDMAFNFTPQNVPSFYAGTLAPESVEISMSFCALEYYLAGDYGSGLPVDELADNGFTNKLGNAWTEAGNIANAVKDGAKPYFIAPWTQDGAAADAVRNGTAPVQ